MSKKKLALEKKEEEPVVDIIPATVIEDDKASSGELEQLATIVSGLATTVHGLVDRLDQLQPASTEPPSSTKIAVSGEESDIIKSVRDILGEGFEVNTQPVGDGVSFKLTVVPPVHLKEHKDDRRSCNIPFVEGVSGAENFARKVKAYCINWANVSGITYAQ